MAQPLWPKSAQLLPSRLLEAVSAVEAGQVQAGLDLLERADAEDALTSGVARLVRGLAAAERGADAKARRLLGPLLRDAEPAVALHATLALVELHLRNRRYSRALPLLRRAQRLQHDEDAAVVLDAALLRVELLRRGHASPERVASISARLKRNFLPPVHATVHLLQGEHALLQGDFVRATRALRDAAPYVRSARSARVERQHATLQLLLDEAPFAEVEDWLRPLRQMSRAQVAELQSEPWQRWLDFLHLEVKLRSEASSPTQAAYFAAAPDLWAALAAVARAPRQRLSWAQAEQALDPAQQPAHDTIMRLATYLEDNLGTSLLEVSANGFELPASRFVHMHLTGQIPAVERLLLATLAAHPGCGTAALELMLATPRRTIVRHLGQLRRDGFVRLVGGGRESRYALI